MNYVDEDGVPIHVPEQLQEVCERVKSGEQVQAPVRHFIAWFYGTQRRGRWVVERIREALAAVGLRTEPDFNEISIDAIFEFLPLEPSQPAGSSEPDNSANEPNVQVTTDAYTGTFSDPTYRIRRLAIAARAPVFVGPTSPIEHAMTLMIKYDFSQLPVMTGERDLKGVISWKSIGMRRGLGQQCKFVMDAMEEHKEISADASLFDAVQLLRDHDCILVRESDKRITGIITSHDISETFGQLGEPFLVIGEIENHIRDLIDGCFRKDELQAARDPLVSGRTVEDVSNLTFGEYLRLIENPANWSKLGLKIDRAILVADLKEVRRIRNEVMHFDPEGIEDDDLKKLRDFLAFVRRIQKARPRPMAQHAEAGNQ